MMPKGTRHQVALSIVILLSLVLIYQQKRGLDILSFNIERIAARHHDTPTSLPSSQNTPDVPASVLPQQPTVIEAPVGAASQLDLAVESYIRKVNSTNAKANRCVAKRKASLPQSVASINISVALECLHLSTNDLKLEYPIDAEEHYNDIRRRIAKWTQHEQHKFHQGAGYAGPWIENEFISHFEPLFDQEGTNSACLPDLYGPFIPLFIPWVDNWVNAGYQYPPGFAEAVRSVLRPNVPYITVSQNDQGLSIHKNSLLAMHLIPNVLVLSAGGYGYVPVPLLKQNEAVNNIVDVRDRSIGVSYVGSLSHAPYDSRRLLNDELLSLQNDTSLRYVYHYGKDWREIMADSRYSLVPRGFGRTAYHLMETLQMGLVPIYVYLDNDSPWIPYEDLFLEIGYATTFNQAKKLLQSLQNTSLTELRQREERILSLRETHFSVNGTLNHIGNFMRGTFNDLKCQALPLTVIGKRH